MSIRDILSGGAGGGLPSNFTKDPRQLLISDGTQYTLAGSDIVDAAGFWTKVTANGAARTTATAGVYGTICDLTGRGVLAAVMPPCLAGGSDTASWRITVDGKEYIIERSGPWLAAGGQGRPILGAASPYADNVFTTAGVALTWATNGRSDRVRPNGSYLYLLPVSGGLLFGTPMLYFDKTLKVETKVSAVHPSGTYSQYSAAIYQLLG